MTHCFLCTSLFTKIPIIIAMNIELNHRRVFQNWDEIKMFNFLCLLFKIDRRQSFCFENPVSLTNHPTHYLEKALVKQ